MDFPVSNEWQPAWSWMPSSENIIDVWLLDLTILDEDWHLLSCDESERAHRIVIKDKRNQKAAARVKLRRILSRYVNTDPKNLNFEYGEHGKPNLPSKFNTNFNLSHSEKIGIVGVTKDVRIGIDLERLRPGRDLPGLAQRFFSLEENMALHNLTEPERITAFYRAWTSKEAYLKALGTGLSFPSNKFTIDYTNDGSERIINTDMPGDDPSVWYFSDVTINTEFVATVCFEGPERPIRWWKI